MDTVLRRFRRTGGSGEGSTLLVASTGGHLAQLHRLRPRLEGVPQRVVWVTFDTPQSRSLLADEHVHYVSLVKPRDLKNVLRNMRFARRLFREHDVRAVVSTGSGIALSFLPLARASRIPTLYIDSAARSAGPSVTGRLLALVPGMRLLSQYPAWADAPWAYAGSVFDEFEPGPATDDPRVRKVVVTLGTIDYPFERLVRRLGEILPAHVDVFWQLGDTHLTPASGEVMQMAPSAELQAEIAGADVVIAHAGVGSALGALEGGRRPVLVPRRAAHGEHVDDHQEQIAGELQRRGLAVHAEADELSYAHLEAAAAAGVGRAERLRPISVLAA
jgi:UDP-N-acetylglucosamine--N-acetylmuramyl-(pentapeptide) pyrophosphoryl-undecaprenol N-acetylglucosamine transferase